VRLYDDGVSYRAVFNSSFGFGCHLEFDTLGMIAQGRTRHIHKGHTECLQICRWNHFFIMFLTVVNITTGFARHLELDTLAMIAQGTTHNPGSVFRHCSTFWVIICIFWTLGVLDLTSVCFSHFHCLMAILAAIL
jgi:hypothetical protein